MPYQKVNGLAVNGLCFGPIRKCPFMDVTSSVADSSIRMGRLLAPRALRLALKLIFQRQRRVHLNPVFVR